MAGVPFWQSACLVAGRHLPRCVPPSRFSVAGTDRGHLPQVQCIQQFTSCSSAGIARPSTGRDWHTSGGQARRADCHFWYVNMRTHQTATIAPIARNWRVEWLGVRVPLWPRLRPASGYRSLLTCSPLVERSFAVAAPPYRRQRCGRAGFGSLPKKADAGAKLTVTVVRIRVPRWRVDLVSEGRLPNNGRFDVTLTSGQTTQIFTSKGNGWPVGSIIDVRLVPRCQGWALSWVNAWAFGPQSPASSALCISCLRFRASSPAAPIAGNFFMG